MNEYILELLEGGGCVVDKEFIIPYINKMDAWEYKNSCYLGRDTYDLLENTRSAISIGVDKFSLTLGQLGTLGEFNRIVNKLGGSNE